jgi:hypothetical protein
MRESYVKGQANHSGPESCGGARKSDGEALTGEGGGRVLSRERYQTRDADLVRTRGRQQPAGRIGEARWYPARSKTPGMYGSNLGENREILRPPKPARWGRIEKTQDVRR